MDASLSTSRDQHSSLDLHHNTSANHKGYEEGLEVCPAEYSGLQVVPVGGQEEASEKKKIKSPFATNQIDDAGLQSYTPDYSGIQAVSIGGLERVTDLKGKEDPFLHIASELSSAEDGDIPRRKRKYKPLWKTAAVLLVVITIVAVSISVTLKIDSTKQAAATAHKTLSLPPNATSTTNISTMSSSPDDGSESLSRTGAFDGTSIGTISPAYSEVQMIVLFQHHTGQMREARLSSTWQGGTANDTVVSSNIKNGTAISAATYIEGSNLTYHVVYVDLSGTLRDVKQINNSGSWIPGSLGNYGFTLSNTTTAGLVFVTGPDWPISFSQPMSSSGEKRIYYGGSDNLVHEVSSAASSDDWSETFVFPSSLNANAGLAGSTISTYGYLYGLDPDNNLGAWWINRNASAPSPVDVWTKGQVSTSILKESSSLATPNDAALYAYVFFQDVDNNVMSIQANANGTSPYPAWGQSFQVGQVGNSSALSSTHIGIRVITDDTTLDMKVYFQSNETDIIEWTAGIAGGAWSSTELPVG